ncbi:MAG: phosphatidate cytidylyltransferase [Gammaproteobacteria bacterium RIFCSPHIGHO2_12_FULL_41_15]|nr:MAG: phosphatidate cytidylyltransferase [Gammaproteobacteria bacterium RIFCSPHIGHO2_12_FULL_41_15]
MLFRHVYQGEHLIQLPLPNVLIIMALIYALLGGISGWVFIAKRFQAHRNFTELTQRIKTFWVIVIVLSFSLFMSTRLAIVFWAMVSYLALKEYFTIIPTRAVDRRILFWAYLSIPLQYYWIATNWYGMFIIFIPVYVFLFMPLRMVILGDTRGFLRSVGTLHWGVMMMVYCMSYLAALYMLTPNNNPQAGVQGLILYLLFLNQFNDAAQFFWGKKFGKHKIIPSVSPNKTIEGFVGGIITTSILAVLLAPYLTPVNFYHAIFLGILIAVAGFIGDVTMSALKRDLCLKDTGQLLPGHGGILDRIDSLLFTTPLYFHFIHYFYY